MKRLTFCVVVMALAAAPAAVAEDSEKVDILTLSERATAINRPELGPAIITPESILLGRTSLEPNPRRGHVMLCNDRPCGLFIPGKVDITHIVNDPFSLPVAKRNFKTASREKLSVDQGSGSASWSSDGAIVWSWDPPCQVEVLEEETATPEWPRWAVALTQSELTFNPSTLLLTAEGHANRGFTVVAMRSRKRTLIAVLDPEIDRDEALYVLKKVKGAGRVFSGDSRPHLLAIQPVDRSWWDRPRHPLSAVHTELEVDASTGEDGTIMCRTLLEARRDTAVWRSRLTSFLIDDNVKYPVTVSEVLVDGRAADWMHRNGTLLVAFPTTVKAGSTVEVEVVCSSRLIPIEEQDFWTLGVSAWYPKPRLHDSPSTFDITLKVPEKHLPVASGVTVSKTTEDGVTTLITRVDQPMQWAVVAAGKTQIVEQTRGDLTCRIATYRSTSPAHADRLLDVLFRAVEYYESVFEVNYPYPEVTMLERSVGVRGQAPPGIIYVGRDIFEPQGIKLRRIDSLVAHEVAHAWWGHIAKIGYPEDNWINEGFASYSAALFLMEDEGGKAGEKDFQSSVKHWRGHGARRAEEGASLAFMDHLAGDSSDDAIEATKLRYGRAPYVLHAIRMALRERFGDQGDAVFFTWVRRLLASSPFQVQGTRQLINHLNDLTDSDWQPWFETHVLGSTIPEIEP